MSCLTSKTQVTIIFTPAIYGQTLEGLTHVQVINTLAVDLKGKLKVRVRVAGGPEVLTIQTPSFIMRPGAQEISGSAFTNAHYRFSGNSYATTLSQTRRFPEAEYEYCFEIDITESKVDLIPPIYESCFVQQLQPLTPLLLIDPMEGDETCNKRPNFTWQPPMPVPLTGRYRFILTEVKDKQDVIESISFNQPVINQANIPANLLFFPQSVPELKEGQEYAWQVSLYDGKTILKKSEIWTFKIKCNEVKPPIGDSYRELRENEDGNFYVATRFLRFSFNNPYNTEPLKYSIVSLKDPDEVISRLPAFWLSGGLNKYEIDLSENKVFKQGQEYMLKISLSNGRELKLRVIYQKQVEE